MQEIKKRRIVLASVLKPVNDTRMTEKMGQSLQNDYDVHIIGFPAPGASAVPHLTTHPLPFFKRLSLKRLVAPWKIFQQLLRLKPAVVIITTHELLFPALLARALRGCKLIYDIQENYWRNILYTPAFPAALRPFIASVVRVREWLAAPFINHFFLAEKGYEKELGFLPARFTVLENKIPYPPGGSALLPLAIRYPAGRSVRLLFSGTLAESTGVFTAIALARALQKHDPSVRLTIIGYCAIPVQLARLRREIEATDFIDLIGGDSLVPHADILKTIKLSDMGIVAYPPNPATQNSIPTKLYEYLGNHLPVLLIDHPVWCALCEPFGAGVTFPSDHIDGAAILNQIRTRTFYTAAPTGVYWEDEAKKLAAALQGLF